MDINAWIGFAGGIALFLLGMQLMTEGLKNAAGDRLRAVLTQATRSRTRAIGAGVLVTASVQSSSAVIFALIGFVNAGLLTLAQAIGVILGANVGTTATSWLVALAGFKLDLQALALPLLIVGMALRVLRGRQPSGAFGLALVGLGLFFLGLDLLKGGFDELATTLDLTLVMQWPLAVQVAAMVGVGVVLTVLMQSSSAALAVVLTGAAAGWISLPVAMAMVIGANVGTTSTAAFAVIGATAPAKRAAAAHVLFAVIVAGLALATFPFAQMALEWVDTRWGGVHIAVLLALFHTYTKVLGLVLVLPFADRLAAWLERRFRAAEPSAAGAASHAPERVRMAYLDEHVLLTPTLAIAAAQRELQRMQRATLALLEVASRGAIDSDALDRARRQRIAEIVEFCEWVAAISSDDERDANVEQRAALLYAGQYLQDVLERSATIRVGALAVDGRAANDSMVPMIAWRDDVLAAIRRWTAVASDDTADSGDAFSATRDAATQASVANGETGIDVVAVQRERAALEAEYHRLKQGLILGASARAIPAARLVEWLDALSDWRRVLDQWAKLTLRLGALHSPSLTSDAATIPAPAMDRPTASAAASDHGPVASGVAAIAKASVPDAELGPGGRGT